MTFKRLKEISHPHFYGIFLDKYFPKLARSFLRKGSAIAALVSFFLSFFDTIPFNLGKADGLFFLFIFVYLSLSFLEFFYRSMMGEGLKVLVKDGLTDKNDSIDYALSSILFATDDIDATKAVLETKIGLEIMIRSGILPQDLKSFVSSERSLVVASSLNLAGEQIGLVQYIEAVYNTDKSLQSFLAQNSVNKEEFLGAVKWVGESVEKRLRKERFWSRENLGSIPSIGTSWSYGVSYDLGKFGVPFENMTNVSSLDIENGYRGKEVTLLEMILSRTEEANAVIIDDDEKVARDIIGRFLKKIKLGVSQPSVENKNIIELDWNGLVASYKNKGDLERELMKIFNESLKAGNVIMYIRDLAGFVSSAKSSGVNLPSVISPYLASKELQVVASVTNADFHFFIETSPALLERFERIIPDPAGVEATIEVLLEQAPYIENENEFFFSYPSILALANSADRFITYGEMPGKAIDMLVEIAPWATEKKIFILKKSDVNAFASEKTGIATGAVEGKEAEKIGNLEEILHRRIIGQNEAINGIANAVRRSRSGVNNPKRPISSFLFLGPTGVGKTEVSKALAESFFGTSAGEEEKKMIRFDMSEYNGPDAISRLIGDFALNKSGILASKVRDNPYSVLLLDEFEKAAPDVLDLFLQILDEGIFTDSLGKQVNCRNLIIIATSNAGSDLIWEAVKTGKDLLSSKDTIVDSIIKNKIFKPELLNRFDGIILFHPLQKDDLEKVARLSLTKLVNRLKSQDIELVINDDVVNFLVEKGSDPQFGGRSINRAIQDKLENIIARKIVSGEAKPGSKIEIKSQELN